MAPRAVVYHGAAYQLFVDGQPDGQGTSAGCNEGAHGEPPWSLHLGFSFVDNLDEVALWNVPLSQAQVVSALA